MEVEDERGSYGLTISYVFLFFHQTVASFLFSFPFYPLLVSASE